MLCIKTVLLQLWHLHLGQAACISFACKFVIKTVAVFICLYRVEVLTAGPDTSLVLLTVKTPYEMLRCAASVTA